MSEETEERRRTDEEDEQPLATSPLNRSASLDTPTRTMHDTHPDGDGENDDDSASVADTELSSVVADVDENTQSTMTVTGATASHLKRELFSAIEGKRTIRRLSMAHAVDCEQDSDQLEYATISGARGAQMREELSFAVSHPTHGEIHAHENRDEEFRQSNDGGAGARSDEHGTAIDEAKAMDRESSIKNLLSLAHHNGETASITADEIVPDVDVHSYIRDSAARRPLRRHTSLVLTPFNSAEASHMYERRGHIQRCHEASESLELIGKAVSMHNPGLGSQLKKHVDSIRASMRRVSDLDSLESAGVGGGPHTHLKTARRMARHINAEVVKARRAKWNQMLGYSDMGVNDMVGLVSPLGTSPSKAAPRKSISLGATGLGREGGGGGVVKADSERLDASGGDATVLEIENGNDCEASPLKASVQETEASMSIQRKRRLSGSSSVSRAVRFLRTNLFTSTAPALLLCVLYTAVILALRIHEEHPYSIEHVHAMPFTTYLKPSPLQVVEVEVRFATPYASAGGGGHRKSRARRRRDVLTRALSALSVGMPAHSQFTLSLEQLRWGAVAPGIDADWVPLQVTLLDIYDTDEVRQHIQLRPENAFGRVQGAPLRVRVSSLETHTVAYVSVHQLGWIGDAQRWIALAILLFVLLMIAVEIVNRVIVAMMGSFMMLLLLILVGRPPTLPQVIEWVDEGTLGLLFGMMIMVGKLSATGFFEVSTLKMVGLSRGRTWYLFMILCLLTAALSAFLDNVTTVLLIAPATLELCKKLDIDPIPMLVGEILFSNIGGAATMIGDPPNIIVGNALSSELTFTDFLAVLAPGVLVIAPFALLLLRYIFKEKVTGQLQKMDVVMDMRKDVKITDTSLFCKSMIVLGCTVLLFLLHPVHHCDPAWIALIGAATLMLVTSPHDVHHDLEYVEWDTLIFFASLFVMVEAMGEVGLIRSIGDMLTDIIKSVPESRRLPSALSILMWASALISGFLDNIPYTATMVPVIQQLSNAGLGLEIKPLAFALCFGACLGGNGSLVGASANIVVAGIANRMGHHISFTSFIKVSFPVMLLSVALANGYLVLRYT